MAANGNEGFVGLLGIREESASNDDALGSQAPKDCGLTLSPRTEGVTMSTPTQSERIHYAKLVGRQIVAVIWEDVEGQPLPILQLSGCDRYGNAAIVVVLADLEGNGPGHLDHSL